MSPFYRFLLNNFDYFKKRFDADNPRFFTDDVKIAVINFILERTSFVENSSNEDASEGVGIQKLLNDGVFRDAFPLHDVCSFPFSFSLKK